jgi:ABC-type lipoprotein release transport system permease subunit
MLGVGIGVAAAVLLAPRLEGMLCGVPTRDPATFATVAVALTLVALMAAWLPARRASQLDPVSALRGE